MTHVHLDHFGDICAVIEGSRKILHDKDKNYFKKGTLITTRDTLKYISDYHLNMLEKIISFKETCEYCAPLDVLNKIGKLKTYTDKDYPAKKHMDVLRIFCKLYGKNYCMKLLKKNPKFFDKYTDYPVEPSK